MVYHVNQQHNAFFYIVIIPFNGAYNTNKTHTCTQIVVIDTNRGNIKTHCAQAPVIYRMRIMHKYPI